MADGGIARRPNTRRRIVWIIVATLILLLLAIVAWLGVRGWLAKGELEKAAQAATSAQDALEAQDAAAATAAAQQLASHASEAASLTGDPIWGAAELLGPPGENLKAVRLLASALDHAAVGAIEPIAQLTTTMQIDQLRAVDGRIDLAPLAQAAPVVEKARKSLDEALATAKSAPDGQLMNAVASARGDLIIELTTVSQLVNTLDDALAIVPPLLGADGPRNYLLLFQNNAELRASGGIPGAMALVHVDDGAMALTAQATASDFRSTRDTGANSAPALAVSAETESLYGNLPGLFMQDVTMTPDFAESASLAKQMWEQRWGTTVDGVIALDPVALSYLLEATGPVALADGSQLTSGNVVRALLLDAYQSNSGWADPDAYFAGVANSVFAAMTSSAIQPQLLIDGLSKAASEHRLLVWSADAAEQKRIATTSLAGIQAAQLQSGEQAYGVYFNDATGGKMGSYLGVAIDVGAVEERADGRADVTVRVTLTNTAPADANTALPASITGNGNFGVAAGKIATNVLVYAPKGAFDGGVTRDGQPATYLGVDAGGQQVNTFQVKLNPGESSVSEFHFIAAQPGQNTPTVLHTPLVSYIEIGAL